MNTQPPPGPKESRSPSMGAEEPKILGSGGAPETSRNGSLIRAESIYSVTSPRNEEPALPPPSLRDDEAATWPGRQDAGGISGWDLATAEPAATGPAEVGWVAAALEQAPHAVLEPGVRGNL